MNIYNDDQNSPGNIAMKLSDIKGTGGPVIGETKHISQAVEQTGNFGEVTYDKVLKKTLVIRVFLSASRMDSILCQATLGQ
jgi:hypothetical protein